MKTEMRSEKEIEEMRDRADESEENLFGMTYQDGICDALSWVLDPEEDPPLAHEFPKMEKTTMLKKAGRIIKWITLPDTQLRVNGVVAEDIEAHYHVSVPTPFYSDWESMTVHWKCGEITGGLIFTLTGEESTSWSRTQLSLQDLEDAVCDTPVSVVVSPPGLSSFRLEVIRHPWPGAEFFTLCPLTT